MKRGKLAIWTSAKYSATITTMLLLVNAALAVAVGYLYAYLMDNFRWTSGGEIIATVILAVVFGNIIFSTTKSKIVSSILLLFFDASLTFFGIILFIGEAL